MSRCPHTPADQAEFREPRCLDGWNVYRVLVITLLLIGLGGSRMFAAVSNRTSSPPKTLLSLDRIFSSNDFADEPVAFRKWRDDGVGYFVLEPLGTETNWSSLVFVDAGSGAKECVILGSHLIPPGGSQPIPVHDFQFSPDQTKLLIFTYSQQVWRQNTRGDYWVLDRTDSQLQRLGQSAAPGVLMFAKFAPDSKSVAYIQENNIFIQRLSDLRITAITTNGSASLINGTFDWVNEEELDLRDGFAWSPDGHHIAYWQTDTTGVREHQMIRNTDELYPVTRRWPYPKAGERNSSVRLGVQDIAGGDTRWMDIPGDPREHYLGRMNWTSNSTDLLIQQFNRVQNTNHVWLANASSGIATSVLVETDDAWVENENDARWIAGGKEFLWLSDRSGWQQLYRVDALSGTTRSITSGTFDITSVVGVDEKLGCIYYLASPENPTQLYLYRVPIHGGDSERLTPESQPGTHHYRPSPQAEWAIHTYSTFTQPPVTDLIHLSDHRSVRSLATNQRLKETWTALKRPAAELFRVTLTHGVALDGWCLKPPGFKAYRKYPVLFHVYGEPHGQVVTDAWHGRNHLWHNFLAQQGYVVIAIDSRGSYSPRGRDWRKYAHRQIGILTVADQAAAATALLKKHRYLDSKRVGIWGWSGGGTLSLNAIFQYPDLYQTAIAVAAVPNLRYYDTIYEERYMGLPRDNAEGYRLGSPITHAHKLKGNLLIIHGTGDDNVHYQGVEALVNELVANQKPFTLMSYPDRTHSISEGRGTTRHLYELMTRYLADKLPVDSYTPRK